MAKVVDANVIIRYLVGGSPQLIRRIRKLFEKSKEKLILTDVTIAEIVWVLESYYKQGKEDIADKILSLLEVPVFITNRSLISKAIYYYREHNIDYVDAYLASLALEEKALGIVSFDRSIDKVKDVRRFEP